MLNAVVDFTGCHSYRDLYKIIKNHLIFPNSAGENPDALWECLMGFMETPTVIEF